MAEQVYAYGLDPYSFGSESSILSVFIGLVAINWESDCFASKGLRVRVPPDPLQIKKKEKMKKQSYIFIRGFISIAQGIVSILTLGFVYPTWVGDFDVYYLTHLFDNLEKK